MEMVDPWGWLALLNDRVAAGEFSRGEDDADVDGLIIDLEDRALYVLMRRAGRYGWEFWDAQAGQWWRGRVQTGDDGVARHILPDRPVTRYTKAEHAAEVATSVDDTGTAAPVATMPLQRTAGDGDGRSTAPRGWGA